MNKVTITRVSFGFPVNVTESINIEEIDSIKKRNFSNKNLHLKITLDKELKKNFNSEVLANEIRESTKAENVKISFVYNSETLVRSKEIANTQKLSEKFKKYAELNDVKYKNSVLHKIDDLQESLVINNSVPSDSFELEMISLRGAIGIMEGQGKEEITINLKGDYSDGIIALQGANGSGKSTLLENMHPFPQMLTRAGTLKDHFCLKDSHRILIYKDSHGNRIKITFLIDGAAKSVLTRYTVAYQYAGTENWTPETSLDGGYDSYKAWCESKFGSISMFMRTSFSANKEIKNIPDLANATKSEKMSLFSTLAGIDYLGAVALQAKNYASKEEKIVEDIKGQLQNFDNIEQRIDDININMSKNLTDLENYNKLIDIDNQELELYNEEQKKYLAAAGAYDLIRTTLNDNRIKAENIQRDISSVNVSIDALNEEVQDIDLYKEQITWFDDNMKKRESLSVEQNKLESEKYKKFASADKMDMDNKAVQKCIEKKENEAYKLSLEINSLKKIIPTIDSVCPVCGSPISEHKKGELEKEAADISEQITQKEELIKLLNAEIVSEKKKIVDTTSIREEIRSLDNKIISIINDITTINEYAASIDIDKAKDVINNSTVKMEEFKKKLETLQNEYDSLTKTINEMEESMNNIPTDYSDKIARLTRGIQDSQQHIAILTAENTSMERELRQLEQHKDKVQEIKDAIKEHLSNIKEYTLIAQSFGNDGIQAIELDSAAPEISDITNSILNETYGDRFSIKFDTQRNSKNGKKKIDDFVINVFDSKSGREKRLDVLSGGESIWIKQALYYAFSVIRSRRTGFCFRTRFLDEADGALDSESRVKYLKMIELAHTMCNATQTILITHSPEIKEIVEQRIEF